MAASAAAVSAAVAAEAGKERNLILKIVIGAIIAILVILLLRYNRFVKLKVKVDEGFSTMDVYLKKRFDLIPNLVGDCKGAR